MYSSTKEDTMLLPKNMTNATVSNGHVFQSRDTPLSARASSTLNVNAVLVPDTQPTSAASEIQPRWSCSHDMDNASMRQGSGSCTRSHVCTNPCAQHVTSRT